jgi:hypothetical protein
VVGRGAEQRLSRHRQALAAARPATASPFEPGFTNRALAEEIEAVMRTGMLAATEDADRRLTTSAFARAAPPP